MESMIMPKYPVGTTVVFVGYIEGTPDEKKSFYPGDRLEVIECMKANTYKVLTHHSKLRSAGFLATVYEEEIGHENEFSFDEQTQTMVRIKEFQPPAPVNTSGELVQYLTWPTRIILKQSGQEMLYTIIRYPYSCWLSLE